MSSDEKVVAKGNGSKLRLAIWFLALFAALVLGYLLGVRQGAFAAGATHVTSKPYQIKLGNNIDLRLSVGTLGVAVIFFVMSLLLIAVLLAMVAQRRRRSVQATSKNLLAESETRRQAEKSLLENQRLLNGIINNATAVISVKDLDGRYVLVNHRFSEIVGVSDDAVRSKTDYDLFPSDVADRYRALDLRAASAPEAITEEEAVPQSDGLHTYISVKGRLLDSQDKPYATFGISADITDLKRSQEALRASDTRTRLVIETALDAVVTMNAAGVLTGWNPQAESIFGWNASEVLGRSMKETILPERLRQSDLLGIDEYLTRDRTELLNKRIELTAIHRDGHEFPIEASIVAIPTGETVTFSAFVRDITDRRQAEQKVKAQLERLNLLHHITRAIAERLDLSSIFQVVIRTLEDSLNLDFCCIFLYDDLRRVLTVSQVGVNSPELADEVALDEKAEIAVDQNGLAGCLTGKPIYEPDTASASFPFPQRLAGRGLRSMVISPLPSESKTFGILVAARKNTNAFSSGDCEFLSQLGSHVGLAAHQAQLYSALQQAYDDLRQAQQAVLEQERLRVLGQMASGIAHDINNAISPAFIYVQHLRESEKGLSERSRGYLEVVEHSLEDVAHTVGRMREFYRQQEPQLQLVPVSLNRTVSQVIELTRARWQDIPQQNGSVIVLRTELTPDESTVMGVESEIREALTNLILNAADAMPAGGELTIRTRALRERKNQPEGAPRTESVAVEVSDTGIGMDEETRQRCLEPFFTTKGERGTGLGLAMVYGIAQRHQADMEIESSPGKGTTVRLVFVGSSADAASTSSAAQPSVKTRLRILIVDDDPILIKSLRDALELDGHTVVSANGGQAGIDTFATAHSRNQIFNVVITDLGMPYVDGRQVSNAIKSKSPNTPVILLTGWGQRMSDAGDVPPHVDIVLNKPPKLRELREALNSLHRGLPKAS